MSVPNSADSLYLALQQAQARHQLFPDAPGRQPQPVVVGVSGGADSVCLLHLLRRVAGEWHLALHVAHLDHNIRPDSAQDAAFVEELAQDWGLPFHSRRLSPSEVDEAGNNLEAALRQLRYSFLAGVATDLTPPGNGWPIVAVAHTADDQSETILMHILRGSGLTGLAGMRPRTFPALAIQGVPVQPPQPTPPHSREGTGSTPPPQWGRLGGGEPLLQGKQPFCLVRPLLDVSRTHILQYLNAHNLAWREDPSNRDLSLTRNRLRHTILPQLRELYPNLTGALTRLGEIVAAESDRAEALDWGAFQALLEDESFPLGQTRQRVVLNRLAWQELDLAARRGVLRIAGLSMELPAEELTYERLEKLRLALESDGLWQATPLAGSIVSSADAKRFSLHRSTALAFPPLIPFLDEEWRAATGRQPLRPGESLVIDGWRLTCQEVAAGEQQPNWRASDDPWQMVCDAQQAGPLLLTTPQPGQRFAPLGMDGHHKQLGNFFTDCKVDPALRPGWPLLVDASSGEIVWVCGLRLAHHARLRTQTTKILQVKWSKE